MTISKPKALALFVLLSLIGQVAATPFLMCQDMDNMSGTMDASATVAASFSDNADAEMQNQLNQGMPNDVADRDCKSCVSCSSVLNFENRSAPAPALPAHNFSDYSNLLLLSFLDNPFRPPITA